jgi:serine phosphatase RsbU (regulator of sigma subunit)
MRMMDRENQLSFSQSRRLIIFAITTTAILALLGAVVWRGLVWHQRGWSGLAFQQYMTPEDEARGRALSFGFSSGVKSLGVLLVAPDSPASKGGIAIGDTVVSVNEISGKEKGRLKALSDQLKTGDEIRYVIETDGGRVSRHVRLASPYDLPHVRIGTATSVLIGLAYFSICVLVFLSRRDDDRAFIFFLLFSVGAAFFLVMSISEVEVQAYRGVAPSYAVSTGGVVTYAVYVLLSLVFTTLLLHFSLIFPKPLAFVAENPRTILLIHSLPFIFVIAIGCIAMAMKSKSESWQLLAMASTLALVTGTGVRMWRVAREVGWLRASARRPLTMQMLVFSAAGLGFLLLSIWARDPFAMGFFLVVFCTAGFALTVFGYAVLSCVVLGLTYRRSSGEERRQLRWPLWGAIGGIAGSSLVSMVIFGLTAAEIMPREIMVRWAVYSQVLVKGFYLLIPLGFAFGVVKYRLMEMDVVIKRTLVYSVVSGIVLLIYFSVVAGVGQLLVGSTGVKNQTLVIVATLAVAALFVPMRNRVQAFVDARFFRRRFDYQQQIRKITEGLRVAELEDEVYQLAADHLQPALQVRSVVVLGKTLDETFSIAASSTAEETDFGSASRIQAASLASIDTVTPIDASALGESERQLLREELGTALLVPVKEKGRLLAMISIGSRLSDQEFDVSDEEFLASIAERLALTLEKLRLRAEEQEFRQAQQIQQALLPSVIPQIAGCDIAAKWQPARSVGGDYYDVIPFDEHSVAICIGDVVGKGLPAALLMSSLQATVRAVAAADVSPRELCEKVRKVVAGNLNRGKFITFFYCVLDVRKGTLTFTNAGHNPPVLIGEDGEVRRLSGGGAALGRLFAAIPFGEETVAVRSGDRLVLFTDGVSEAEDGSGSAFGEDRLTALVGEQRHLAAGPLLTCVLDSVTSFSSGNLQDDVTIASVAIH